MEAELQRIEQASIKDCILHSSQFEYLHLIIYNHTLTPVTDDVFLSAHRADIKESQNIALLHNQITACDSILEVRRLRQTENNHV